VRIKLDENVPQDAVAVFTDGGHDVHTIPDEDLVGRPDADVWRACVAEHRMLVTFDLGFGDIRAYPPATHSGVVVLRLMDQRPDVVTDVLRRFLADYDLDTLSGHLIVVTDTLVRLRRE
jgi:predicted nuclease of predicted toxin-antitoxin system